MAETQTIAEQQLPGSPGSKTTHLLTPANIAAALARMDQGAANPNLKVSPQDISQGNPQVLFGRVTGPSSEDLDFMRRSSSAWSDIFRRPSAAFKGAMADSLKAPGAESPATADSSQTHLLTPANIAAALARMDQGAAYTNLKGSPHDISQGNVLLSKATAQSSEDLDFMRRSSSAWSDFFRRPSAALKGAMADSLKGAAAESPATADSSAGQTHLLTPANIAAALARMDQSAAANSNLKVSPPDAISQGNSQDMDFMRRSSSAWSDFFRRPTSSTFGQSLGLGTFNPHVRLSSNLMVPAGLDLRVGINRAASSVGDAQGLIQRSQSTAPQWGATAPTWATLQPGGTDRSAGAGVVPDRVAAPDNNGKQAKGKPKENKRAYAADATGSALSTCTKGAKDKGLRDGVCAALMCEGGESGPALGDASASNSHSAGGGVKEKKERRPRKSSLVPGGFTRTASAASTASSNGFARTASVSTTDGDGFAFSEKASVRKQWTPEEEEKFLKALEKLGPKETETDPRTGRVSVRLGPGVAEIISMVVGTRSVAQVRSHAQKHYIRKEREASRLVKK